MSEDRIEQSVPRHHQLLSILIPNSAHSIRLMRAFQSLGKVMQSKNRDIYPHWIAVREHLNNLSRDM